MATGQGPESAASRSTAAAALARTQIFRGLDITALEALAREIVTKTYDPHQLVFCQGDDGDRMYIVDTGMVKLLLTSPNGDVVLLSTAGPGDTFGELALLDGGPRSATAQTQTGSRLLSLGREALLRLLRDPSVQDAVLLATGSMVRRLTERAADRDFLDLTARLAKLLLALANSADAPGEAAAGPAVVRLAMTQTDLANLLGGTRQSVNQILAELQKREVIELRGDTILIRRRDYLRHRAGM